VSCTRSSTISASTRGEGAHGAPTEPVADRAVAERRSPRSSGRRDCAAGRCS
jgi:hypothetical protein